VILKNFILLLLFLNIISCTSVKKHNQFRETLIAPEKLHHDVDFAYRKLQELHPDLYAYISKERLHTQFDSLKATIREPLKPNAFYQKLAPVIAKVKQGHLRLYSYEKWLTKQETKKLKNKKGLWSRFNFIVDGDRIFVLDNADKIPNMEVGTELLKINDESVSEMLNRYKVYVNSDGYNTTFQKYYMAKAWPKFFTLEKGNLDSVKLQTRLLQKTNEFFLTNETKSKTEKKAERKEVKTKENLQKNKDYNAKTKSYNRDITFKGKDSSIAVMTIKSFSGYRSKKFYKESFEKLRKNNCKALIIDMRNNFGGSLSEINNLYSYLAHEKFQFIKDIEVTSGKSMYHADYFKHFSIIGKPFAVALYPFYFIVTTFSNKNKDGRHYLRNNTIFTLKNPKKTAFTGKVYVLINGGSFSAASILPSKLKNDQLAFLVGEETGGANDGTVAGRYATEQLPNSKLKLPIGLMLIQPDINFTHTQRGVLPDLTIIPTLQENLQKKDVQMEALMAEIEKNLN